VAHLLKAPVNEEAEEEVQTPEEEGNITYFE
jgi:hypothetical protein